MPQTLNSMSYLFVEGFPPRDVNSSALLTWCVHRQFGRIKKKTPPKTGLMLSVDFEHPERLE